MCFLFCPEAFIALETYCSSLGVKAFPVVTFFSELQQIKLPEQNRTASSIQETERKAASLEMGVGDDCIQLVSLCKAFHIFQGHPIDS